MTLVPANGTNHPISVTTGVHYRRTALRFTASKHAAICCSNDRKSACAALGLARNTISQDSGKADSYFRASTRKRRLTALRVTALPDSLGNGQTDTSAPHRRRIVDNGIVVHQIMHDDVFSRYPTTAFEHRDEIAMAFQPFHRSMPLNQAARDLRPWRGDG